MATYRPLTKEERGRLESQGCLANDWSKVAAADPADIARIRDACFLGEVAIGRLAGTVRMGAVEHPCGIYRATLGNAVVGDGCLIKNVGHLSGYQIGDGAVLEQVGTMTTEPGSTFGCGTKVEAVNEGGGREVFLYPELSAQVAHLMALHRYRPGLMKRLEAMIEQRTQAAKADRGRIGAGALVRGVQTMRNVNVGAAAQIEGAACLENGTILSEPDAKTKIGSGVVLREFIVAEASSVTDGAMLEHCYIGQGCKVGRGFSGENCLFFANCEAVHGEGCALFAGPYTVTHHKSSLLIGAQFSFYNAGSGTNQSNHMYKLGPVHQGILERGCKTGSFSYLLWPCRVGPFSVVIGKNMANFDLGDLPFSYVSADEGKSYVIPAFNLFTVGTVRDGQKWPSRDRRKGKVIRDLIHFPVFSPYSVGRMLAAESQLQKLSEETDRSVDEISYKGATIKRVLLRSGAKWYRTGIDAYLAEKLVCRSQSVLDNGLAEVRKRLATDPASSSDRTWDDVSGMLVARDRLRRLEDDIESGAVADLKALEQRLAQCYAAYEADEWNWVAAVWEERFKAKPSEMDGAALSEAADTFLANRSRFLKTVLSDAEKEFSDFARTGFGADGAQPERDADFEAVRGTFDGNKFVAQIKAELAALADRVAAFKAKAAALA
jgi:hypothetical protein